MTRVLPACLLALCLILPSAKLIPQSAITKSGTTDTWSASDLSGLSFRSIGPAMTSGRIGDIAVDPRNPWRFFVAVASGGVWRTTNGGATFEPVFDSQGSYSIGCITIDPNNPHVIWVGTGENNSQRSVGFGDGIYRSDDGGGTWKHMGLRTSEHIAKIVVDPRNSRTIYVAVQGPLWAPGGERGLYKSTDAGSTWKPILTISENTGVTDLLMDPRNPDVLIAASYQRRRHVWTLINGGPESRLFRSQDGGATWDTLRTGLPSGDVGRIGLAQSPANPDVLYAIIEATEDKGGVYRSSDRGSSWEKRNPYVSTSPQYYQELVCDPVDVDVVYSLDTYTKITEDGGKTWKNLGNRYRHVDDHALWIDPGDTRHLLIGGDGGLYRSHDRGATWRFFENLPVTQFYRVAVDNSAPFYHVYGGTQDNNSLGGPSRTLRSDGILNEDWFFTNGGDGFESQIDPTNPDIVYAQAQYGWLVRFDKRSGERKGIQPQAAPGDAPLRWNWDSPLLISPHNPTRLYFCAQRVFRSDDRGDSWRPVSGDLTRQLDRNSLQVMGKVWGPDAVAKNASTSLYGNIVAFDESPRAEGLLYVGTDDGLIQVSEDGGATWRRIDRIAGVPDRSYVSGIKASQHSPDVVYATFVNYKMGDFLPYVFRSTDRGRTWNSVTADLPKRGPVHCIVEDHVRSELLFVGTEFGVYVTLNGGAAWMRLGAGLPTISVRDIDIQKRENDLVLATFGRGFYVLDNYAPLRELTPAVRKSPAHLFGVRDALMYIESDARGRGAFGETFFASANPPFGATFTWYLSEVPKTKRERRRDAEKEAEKNKTAAPYPDIDSLREEEEEEKPRVAFDIADADGAVIRTLSAPAAKGLRRITWDLRHPSLTPVGNDADLNAASSMLALPGTYSVTMFLITDTGRTQVAGPIRFTARTLEHVTLPATDRPALAAFQRRLASLQRVVIGTSRASAEAKTRIAAIRTALRQVPASEELQREARDLERRLAALHRLLHGDEVAEKRNEGQPPTLVGRLQLMLYQQWRSTSDPSGSHLTEFERVREGIVRVTADLSELVGRGISGLESRMEAIGAPWTPGRIPQWNDR